MFKYKNTIKAKPQQNNISKLFYTLVSMIIHVSNTICIDQRAYNPPYSNTTTNETISANKEYEKKFIDGLKVKFEKFLKDDPLTYHLSNPSKYGLSEKSKNIKNPQLSELEKLELRIKLKYKKHKTPWNLIFKHIELQKKQCPRKSYLAAINILSAKTKCSINSSDFYQNKKKHHRVFLKTPY